MTRGPEIPDIRSIAHDDGYVVEFFLNACLSEAGMWRKGQSSDGINFHVVEATADVARIAGYVWEIAQQTRHGFWLNLKVVEDTIRWMLHFELLGTPRQKRQALDLYTRAEHIEWEHRLEGEAALEDGALVLRSLSRAS